MSGRILAVALMVTIGVLSSGCVTTISADDVAKSDYHTKLARNYYTDHNITMTQRELYEALKLDPANAEAHYLKGILLMGLNDFDGAAAEYRAALVCNPKLRFARNNLGAVLIEQGNYEEVIQVIEPLLQDPLYETPYNAQSNMGLAYMGLGDFENAKKHLELAVFLNPRFCKGFNNLGLLFLKKQNMRDATSNFEKVIKICPEYGESWYHLGTIYQKTGRTNEAEEAFTKCAAALNDSPFGKRCKARLTGQGSGSQGFGVEDKD
jgi:Tfp pilus assembly protein PilF